MATEKYRYERAPATIQRIARALKLSSFKKEYGGVKSRNTRIPTKTDNPLGGDSRRTLQLLYLYMKNLRIEFLTFLASPLTLCSLEAFCRF